MSHIKNTGTSFVWTPADFTQLGSCNVINKTLQRLVTNGTLRRIERGLYDLPAVNPLTQRTAAPDYRAVVDVA